jgi:uncharacterized membrane protein
MNKIKQLWNNLRSSFWLVPSMIVAASIALAMLLIAAHSTGSAEWLARWPRLFGSSAEGARGMLSAIAGSMMTVVGVTFSMILVTLALVSSQYTSRILRNFMTDRVTQVVLGIFAGIFAYCLVVLRSIQGGPNGFVPSLAVTFGVLLAIGGIGVLIFFIHHIASSIQASSIIASVADETLGVVDRLFPEEHGQEPVKGEDAPSSLQDQERSWQAVPARGNGYIQSIDDDGLLCLARDHKIVVRMERGIGDFVVQNTPLVSVSMEIPPPKELVAALQASYTIDRHRTVYQDCSFGIRQIVDMALRALSPSVNDTTTAVMCVDYLTAIIARMATRVIPSGRRFEEKELRVIALGPTFASLAGEAFDQIRGSSMGNVAIMIRMLGAIETIASLTTHPGRRGTLRDHVQRTAEFADRSIVSPHEKERFASRLARVRNALDTKAILVTP